MVGRYAYDDDDIILHAPMKQGRRAKRTMQRNSETKYEDAWAPLDRDRYDFDECNKVRCRLVTKIMNVMEAERLTTIAMYHKNDIPLPIVEMVLKKI